MANERDSSGQSTGDNSSGSKDSSTNYEALFAGQSAQELEAILTRTMHIADGVSVTNVAEADLLQEGLAEYEAVERDIAVIDDALNNLESQSNQLKDLVADLLTEQAKAREEREGTLATASESDTSAGSDVEVGVCLNAL